MLSMTSTDSALTFHTVRLSPRLSISIRIFFIQERTLIDAALKGKWTQFGDKLKSSAGKIFAYLGAWVIGLAIALLIWPFLLCCCCCPWSCPPCNKKQEDMPYSKCQIIWPAIVALILLVVILVTSIVGIASKFKANKNYNEVACASGIIIDDFLYGNFSLTTPKTYFKGIRNLDTELRDMNSRIGVLNNQIAKVGSTSTGMTDATSKISASKTATAQIPSTNEANLVLTYNTPLKSAPGTTTSTIKSIFPSVLGNKSTTQSLVGTAYTSITVYESILQKVSQAADSYTQNQASYTTQINKALNESNRYATDLETQDSKINDFFKKSGDSFSGITIGEYVFYGVLIGLTAFMMIAVACTAFCMNGKCRIFMYFLCFVLFIFCLIAFIYCIAVSLVNPVLYYSCQYVSDNLNSKAKLTETLVSNFNINMSIAANISECVAADGGGNLAKNILGDAVFSTITSLNTTFNNLVNINTSMVNSIAIIHDYVLANVTAFKTAQYADIDDQSALSELIKLSDHTNYNCDSAGFNKDSWIPASIQQKSYVSCQISQGSYSTLATCTSSTAFTNRDVGCTGCMDTYDLFSGNTSSATVNTALTSRYPNPTCTTFNTELSNVWENFYKKKRDVIGPVETRADTAKSNSDDVVVTADFFTQVKNNIQNNFTSIVDSQYGLLQGLNCETSSSDIRLLKSVVCQGLFLYTYFARVIYGILSFALLFLMCCVTCTGHRNAKQLKFEQKTDPYKKEPISPTMNLNNGETEQQFFYGLNPSQNAYQNNYANAYPNPYPNPYGNPQPSPFAPPRQYNPPYTNYP